MNYFAKLIQRLSKDNDSPPLRTEQPYSRTISPVTNSVETPRIHSPQVISDFIQTTPKHVARPGGKDVAIYDVSDIEPSSIQRPEEVHSKERVSAQDWIGRLELPYERRNLRIPELREAVYSTYEQLAKFIDEQLRQYNSSLEELIAYMPNDEYAHYNNTLYTIFCIAEGHVTRHYSGDGYDNSFSYSLLERRTNTEFVSIVKQYASEHADNLPPPGDDIRRVFGLTPNGLAYVWWDADGYLREHNALSDNEVRVLGLTPTRSTKLYEIPEIRWHIFRYYFVALEELHKYRGQDLGWKVRIGNYLDDVFNNDKRYVYNTQSFMILNQILKLAEQALREKLPYARMLSIDSEIAQIKKVIPRQAADAVQAVFLSVEPPKLSDAAIEALALQNPSAWKQDIAKIKTLDEVISLLKRYGTDENLVKIVKELVKRSDEPRAKLLALYALSASGYSDEWTQKKFDDLIHPQQHGAYTKLVGAKLPLSISTADKLGFLAAAPRRHVVLDEGKMEKARADHNRAVKSVTDYLGESEPSGVEPETQPKISMDTLFTQPSPNQDVSLSDEQKEFMRFVVSSDQGVGVDDATNLAKTQGKLLNGYLQSLNKILYESFEDQVIIQRDGRIVVETEYREAVKELV